MIQPIPPETNISKPLSCVILFDIDGTLLTGPRQARSAGVQAMDVASCETTGKPSPFSGKEYAGRTDPQIARMVLVEAGGMTHPTSSDIDRFLSRYINALSETVAHHPFRLLGQPREAVLGLRAMGAIVGLGTGNIRAGARIKLTSAGISDLFDFENGGFGEDGERRSELLRSGAAMINPSRDLPVVIIGDTPFDVQGAKEMGAFCVGVPFGQNSRTDLVDAGADAVIDEINPSLVHTVARLIGDY
jgi:phosphoglycolate phosphatase-like HAD superfamily hydrolase